jgi:acetyl esterase/lipase
VDGEQKTTQSIFDLSPAPPDSQIKYGSDPLQFADVRVPSGKKPWPVVMNIHGGYWRAKYDIAHSRHLCAGLTKSGFATFNVEYRRVGNPGGGWPGTFQDIRDAYAYVTQQSKELGFDAGRLVIMGHSAGGQLALCLAGHEPTVSRVVSLAGVLDLQKAYDLHLSNDAVVGFLGGTPGQAPEHYREASPSSLKISARQVVIWGTDDEDVPPELSREYVARKTSAGEKVQPLEIPKADHYDLIDPRSEAFQLIVKRVQELLS